MKKNSAKEENIFQKHSVVLAAVAANWMVSRHNSV